VHENRGTCRTIDPTIRKPGVLDRAKVRYAEHCLTFSGYFLVRCGSAGVQVDAEIVASQFAEQTAAEFNFILAGGRRPGFMGLSRLIAAPSPQFPEICRDLTAPTLP